MESKGFFTVFKETNLIFNQTGLIQNASWGKIASICEFFRIDFTFHATLIYENIFTPLIPIRMIGTCEVLVSDILLNVPASSTFGSSSLLSLSIIAIGANTMIVYRRLLKRKQED